MNIFLPEIAGNL